jgi:hypothetical protein
VKEEILAQWGLLRPKQTKPLIQIKMYNRSELGGDGFDLVLEIQMRWASLVTLLVELPYDILHKNIMSVCLYRIAVHLRIVIEIFVRKISIRTWSFY